MCDECEWRAFPNPTGPDSIVRMLRNVGGYPFPHCLTGPVCDGTYAGHAYWIRGEGGFDTAEDHAEAVIRYLLKKELNNEPQGEKTGHA